MSPQANDLVGKTLHLSREVAAPRALVWKVWTDPAHLTRWFAPEPFTIPVCAIDPRPGGKMEFDMRSPDGEVHHCVGRYDEAVPPEKLVFTAGVPGADGKLMFNNRNTVTFTETAGRTTIRVEVVVLQATAEAAPFIAGMDIGWNMTIDQCATYAAKHAAKQA